MYSAHLRILLLGLKKTLLSGEMLLGFSLIVLVLGHIMMLLQQQLQHSLFQEAVMVLQITEMLLMLILVFQFFLLLLLLSLTILQQEQLLLQVITLKFGMKVFSKDNFLSTIILFLMVLITLLINKVI